MDKIWKIYRFVVKYPYDIVMGLITLAFFSVFSGLSITFVIPVFDQIFTSPKDKIIVFKDYVSFKQAVITEFTQIFHTTNFKLSVNYFNPYWASIKQIMSKSDPYMLLGVICVLLVALFFLKNVFYVLNRYYFINLRGKSITAIRNYCYRKYLSQSYAFFNQNRVGDSIVRMVNDIDIVNTLFIDNFLKFIKEFSTILVFAYIAMRLNTRLFLFSILFLPVFSFTINLVSKKIKKYAKKIQNELSTMFSNIEEVLNSMRIVKAFCKEDYEYDRLEKINYKYFKFWRRAQNYWSLGMPIGEISTMVTGVVILLVGSKSILSNNSTFTFGDFTAFIFAVFSMLHPLKTLTNSITDIRKAMVSVERVVEIMDFSSEIVQAEYPVKKNDFSDKIEFEKVCFRYNEQQDILKDISIEIKKGETVAIIGASGSGKTTIANLINRMYDTVTGDIKIDGISIKSLDITSFRKLFGIVTQESILFTDTILNNIRYGSLEPVSDEEIINACKFAYADEFIEDLPDKYNTLILPHAYNLSGGQRQRLCIARAIVSNPPILIFDEATSALDTDSEKKVQNAIDHAAGNRTVILIAHRLSTILSADKIIVLDKGMIVGVGTHAELILSNEKYQHFYNLQFTSKPEYN